MRKIKLIIIRHCDPDYRVDSLTEKGITESYHLRNRLMKMKIKEFYCSPMGRAMKTAEPTLEVFEKEAQICDWLEEFAGYIIDPVTEEKRIPWDLMPDYWTREKDFFDHEKWIKTPLMQSGDVEERYNYVVSSLDKLLEDYGYVRENKYYRVEEETRDTIVLFCHFGVECVLLSHLLNISPIQLWHGFVAQPSSVTTLVTEERKEGKAGFRCIGFGDISHLYAGNKEPSFQARFCENYDNFDERH